MKSSKTQTAKILKPSIKKKCSINEKILSKCHSFGESVFNDFLSSNTFSTNIRSYTVTKKEDVSASSSKDGNALKKVYLKFI